MMNAGEYTSTSPINGMRQKMCFWWEKDLKFLAPYNELPESTRRRLIVTGPVALMKVEQSVPVFAIKNQPYQIMKESC